jgi:hypothetical protein
VPIVGTEAEFSGHLMGADCARWTTAGLTPDAWSLLAVFTTTVAGLVLEPLPTGAWAAVCVTGAIASGALTFAQAFSAFRNDVIWLIVTSFFFAAGFQKTGLGERVANIVEKQAKDVTRAPVDASKLTDDAEKVLAAAKTDQAKTRAEELKQKGEMPIPAELASALA